MRLTRLAVFTVALLAALAFFQGQGRAADFKIAVINDQKLLTDSRAAKSITKQIEAKREGFQKEFSALEQKLREKEKSLLASKDKLKPDDFSKQRIAFQQEVADGQKKAQESRGELEQAVMSARGTLMMKIAEICRDMAKKNGYSMVITRQTVVIADDGLDITDQVLAQLDKTMTDVPMNFAKK